MKHQESDIQRVCVKWFRYQFPDLARNLISVPNGGYRSAVTAAIMKAEGVVSGVSDLILFVPNNDFHALCIEMKTDKGKQSENQILWQNAVDRFGYKYVLCHSLTEFQQIIKDYIYQPEKGNQRI